MIYKAYRLWTSKTETRKFPVLVLKRTVFPPLRGRYAFFGTLLALLLLVACTRHHTELTQADCDQMRYFAGQYPDQRQAMLKQAQQCDEEVADAD